MAEDLPVSQSAQANFSVSATGVLVYRATGTTLSRLVWLDRGGREIDELAGAADYRGPALSPDGRRIGIRRRDNDGTNLDIWVIDPARGTTTRFTFSPGADGNPIWSPDGTQIGWTSTVGDSEAFLVKSAGGLGKEQKIAGTGINSAMLDWSRDGTYVLFQSVGGKTAADIYSIRMDGTDHTPEIVLQTPFNETRAHFSPDGRWIAYQSDESGRNEVYVASFKGAAGKWQISTNGGGDPCWSRDGKELFYLATDQKLMTVPVSMGESFSPGTPQALFRIQTEVSRRRNVFDVSPDGTKFLFLVPVGETNTPITAVINWRAGLGRR